MKFYLILLLAILVSCQRNETKKSSNVENTRDSTLIANSFERASLIKDSSVFYFRQAKEVMQKNGSQRCLASFLLLEGKRNLMSGELDSVAFIADSGLRIPFFPENKFFKGKFYNLKANVAGFKRNIYESLDYYTKAEKVFIETNDSNSLAGIYSNITNSYFSLKDYKTALTYSSKAFNLLKTVQEDRIKTNILITHSLALAKNKQLPKALEMQLKADSISNITQDVMAKMTVAIGYAEIYKSSNQLDSAKLYYERCIVLSKMTGVKHFELMSNVGLLSLYEASQENSKIIEKTDSVIQLAQLMNNLDVIHTSKRIIGRAFAKTGEYEKAFKYLDASYTIYDSTAGVENQKNINELRAKYRFEKSEKEILEQKLLLSNQNEQLQKSRLILVFLGLGVCLLIGFIFIRRKLNRTKIVRMNLENQQKIQTAIIDGEEKERKRLSFEIHDGIASMITGITYKLASNKSEKDEVIGLLNNLHEDSRKIAHNLMPIDFETQNLYQAIENLCAKMSNPKVEVLLMLNGSQLNFSPVKSHLLYRIIQELINNALKHANCQSIFIKIDQEDEIQRFTVVDDGVGMSEESATNNFKSIRERVQLLNGTITFVSKKEQGTEVQICVTNE